jgi:hypothetical protein
VILAVLLSSGRINIWITAPVISATGLTTRPRIVVVLAFVIEKSMPRNSIPGETFKSDACAGSNVPGKNVGM